MNNDRIGSIFLHDGVYWRVIDGSKNNYTYCRYEFTRDVDGLSISPSNQLELSTTNIWGASSLCDPTTNVAIQAEPEDVTLAGLNDQGSQSSDVPEPPQNTIPQTADDINHGLNFLFEGVYWRITAGTDDNYTYCRYEFTHQVDGLPISPVSELTLNTNRIWDSSPICDSQKIIILPTAFSTNASY